jgi:uncharacterized protein YqgC (DUF456 family)
MRLGRGAYWIIGWLLTLVATYAGTQHTRSRGAVTPAVPGTVAVVVGAALCGIGLAIARRSGRHWAGVLIGGIGILCIGIGLANLLR